MQRFFHYAKESIRWQTPLTQVCSATTREALKEGLVLEAKFGTNPYKFCVNGATDSHTALATADEDNFFGKSTSVEPSKGRAKHPFASSDLGIFEGYALVASGYTGI